jgi:methionyl-tRNA synthetase
MDAIDVRKASAELRAIWVAGNEYLQGAAPWTAIKTDPTRAAAIIRLAMNLIRIYAILSRPFIPDAAADMMTSVGSEDWAWPNDIMAAANVFGPGHNFKVPEILFRKITDEECTDWKTRFMGVRS